MATIEWYGRQVQTIVEKRVEVALSSIAIGIVSSARRSMREAKSGRDYRKLWRRQGKKRSPGRGKAGYAITRSSAPGEAPAVQQARLLGSVTWEQAGPLRRRIGTNVPYGLYLELGTKRIRPRPWLRPALNAQQGRARMLIAHRGPD